MKQPTMIDLWGTLDADDKKALCFIVSQQGSIPVAALALMTVEKVLHHLKPIFNMHEYWQAYGQPDVVRFRGEPIGITTSRLWQLCQQLEAIEKSHAQETANND